MGRKPTLKNVAEKAGVSLGLAGRVMGNYGSYSRESKKKVEEAAKALNYIPNSIARSLRTEHTKTIGVLVSDLTTLFWATLVRGIENSAEKAGYSVILCNNDETSEKEQEYLSTLFERNVDGLIVSPTPGNHSYIKRLARADVPIVLVDRHIKGLEVPTVQTDNKQGAFDAVGHIIGLGHERIGIITGVPGIETSELRLEGYKEALKKHKIPFRKSLVREGDFIKEKAFEAARSLLTMKTRPTAVFACNEQMVIGSMLAIRKLGLSVPGDVALAGYDDTAWSTFIEPPLTTVRQPSYTMGMLAFENVLLEIQGGARGKRHKETIVLKPELIVRESCGEKTFSTYRA
ncbi:MAG: LacI family DNA-binding transcriptional regulator [Spirochaetia bacterium]